MNDISGGKKYVLSRNCSKAMCMSVLYFTLFIGFFIYNFGIPDATLYMCDLVVVCLLLLNTKKLMHIIGRRIILKMLFPIFLLVGVGSISAFAHGFGILRWLWSVRNWGRLFAYFLIVIALLDEDDRKKTFFFAVSLYHVNFIVVLVQFVLFGNLYTQDSLNGMFGRSTSSVHLTMTLVVVSIVTAYFISKQIKWKKFVLTMGEVLIISIVSELRVIPVIIVLLLVTVGIATFRPTSQKFKRYLLFLVVGIVAIFIFSVFLKLLYPETAVDYSISGIISAASTEGGYGYSGGIDRLTFVKVINRAVFQQIAERVSGVGMGNAEYSSVASLCSDFYSIYGSELSYLNFSSSMLYVETGGIGIALYVACFAIAFLYFLKRVKRCVKDKQYGTEMVFEVFGLELALINIFYIFYNNLQRTDASFILGFYFALAFIGTQKERRYCGENY